MIAAFKKTFREIKDKLNEKTYTLPLDHYMKMVKELQFLRSLNEQLTKNLSESSEQRAHDLKFYMMKLNEKQGKPKAPKKKKTLQKGK